MLFVYKHFEVLFALLIAVFLGLFFSVGDCFLWSVHEMISAFFSFQELVANSGSDRNWKGMFIATLVILAVFGLIILSVIWLTPPEDLRPVGDKITFDDFLINRLAGNNFNGTWISGTYCTEYTTYLSGKKFDFAIGFIEITLTDRGS